MFCYLRVRVSKNVENGIIETSYRPTDTDVLKPNWRLMIERLFKKIKINKTTTTTLWVVSGCYRSVTPL